MRRQHADPQESQRLLGEIQLLGGAGFIGQLSGGHFFPVGSVQGNIHGKLRRPVAAAFPGRLGKRQRVCRDFLRQAEHEAHRKGRVVLRQPVGIIDGTKRADEEIIQQQAGDVRVLGSQLIDMLLFLAEFMGLVAVVRQGPIDLLHRLEWREVLLERSRRDALILDEHDVGHTQMGCALDRGHAVLARRFAILVRRPVEARIMPPHPHSIAGG